MKKTLSAFVVMFALLVSFAAKAESPYEAYKQGFKDGYKAECGSCFPPFAPFPDAMLSDPQSAYMRGARDGARQAQKDGQSR